MIMEESVKDQTPQAVVAVSGKSKLRYPLRSATKGKEEKAAAAAEPSNSSVSKSGRPASSVSKSLGVLDLSDKEKSAKPPRRLSIPAKSVAGRATKPTGNITPISEARIKRSTNAQGRSETPLSDVSRASSRKKFNMLASASYWLSQVKLSESAANHSISLGFFKLGLEAGCEPLQRMRDELKAYVRRHDISEFGGSVKELFERYNITDDPEQVQVSETCSQVPEEGIRSSDDEVHSSSSTIGTRKLRPRSLNADAAQVSTVTQTAKKEISKNATAPRIRGSQSKNTVNSKSFSDTAGRKLSQKKTQRPSKQETTRKKEMIKKQGKKAAAEDGSISPTADTAITPEENKENMDALPMEEISLTEIN